MNMHPGNKALRIGRASIAGQAYLVTSVTYQRQPHFADWEIATIAARALNDPVLWRASSLLCWVLMPDHWHALVQLAEGDTLGGLMRRLKSTSAVRLRPALGEGVRVWAPAYHDHALREEDDLPDTARYIVANPLRAGLCRSVRQYPFWNAVWL